MVARDSLRAHHSRMKEGGTRVVAESLMLVMAVAAMASSVIFIRCSGLGPGEISGWRMALGAFCFLPFVRRDQWSQLQRGAWIRAICAGMLLGGHFFTWVMGARATVAANATLMVNLVPLVLPFLLLPLAGEKVRARDWAGTLLGFGGVLVLVGASLGTGGTWRGDLICLGSMVLLALYMALGRKAASLFPATAPWLVPVFAIASLTSFAGEWLRVGSLRLPPPEEWKWILLILIFPTLLGHGLVARALRYWRGQVVGVATGGQFLFAGIYGWFAFGELPGPWFPLGAALIVAGTRVVAGKRDKV
jgi:drug/metabolite transporter (DMT)-like permease